MDAIRFPRADAVRALLAALLLAACAGTLGVESAAAKDVLVDAPIVWYDDDDADVPPPRERNPNVTWDRVDETLARPLGRLLRPSRLLRRATAPFGADPAPPAADVNSLDEVPDCSWFTNRIGLYPMSVEDVALGPLQSGGGPDRSGAWTIVKAKTEGVTPGFNVRDGSGAVWVIKFDPVDYPGMASAAGVISNRILWACGYNVPEDLVVYFTRDLLALGHDVEISLPDGTKRPMSESDIDDILAEVHDAGGRYRAIASKFLDGKPVGPFSYRGRRGDDPNDRIRHEHRRELRGLRTIAGWIGHFDTKQQNSLDMFVEKEGRGFVRHYLIDFASTLGAGALGPVYSFNFEHTVDVIPILGRLAAVGLYEDPWRRLKRPEGLDEVAAFESEIYRPKRFKPSVPNPAFVNQTDRDAYWAAKIVSAFTDEQLLAVAEQGRYENPEATRYVARMLAERRDEIARCWFDEVPPLDFFRVNGGNVIFRDLGVERGVYPAGARYRCRVTAVDAAREPAGDRGLWAETEETAAAIDVAAIRAVPQASHPFVEVECQVDRGSGWSRTVAVYVSRRTGRVVAVDRG